MQDSNTLILNENAAINGAKASNYKSVEYKKHSHNTDLQLRKESIETSRNDFYRGMTNYINNVCMQSSK